jgi:formate hydrogenlyase transcriptional activator
MGGRPRNGQTLSGDQQYRTLLAVSEAILAHRDLAALFRDLTGRLQQVVRFDYLILVLHDAATNMMRRHILETLDPSPIRVGTAFPVEDGPAGWVWHTQQPLILSTVAQETFCPRFLENVRGRISSLCDLSLTTARRRLGTLPFGSKQIAAYDAADVDFLQPLGAGAEGVLAENPSPSAQASASL